MDAIVKMLLPALGLTPEKVKMIIDGFRETADNYAADISAIKNDMVEIRRKIENLENKEN